MNNNTNKIKQGRDKNNKFQFNISTFLSFPVVGDIPWCSESLAFKYLKLLPMYEALQLPQVKL